jgi:integrase
MSTIYTRNKTFYIRFTKNGKTIWRSLNTGNRRDARAIQRQIDLLEMRGEEVPESPLCESFDELVRRFVGWAEVHLAPNSSNVYRWAIDLAIDILHPKMVGLITKTDVERLKAAMLARGSGNRTVNHCVTMLRGFVSHCQKMEWYTGPNPFAKITALPIKKTDPQWLSSDQIATVIDTAMKYGGDQYLMFALGIYAGLRKQEIVSARWEWVDFDAGLIRVTQDDGFRSKSRKNRTLPLHATLREILEPYRQTDGFIVAPDATGTAQYRWKLTGFETIAKAAGVPWCTPHTLRHTFASQLVSNGVSLYKVSQWLGHADIKTTQIYAHLSPADSDINRF